MVGTFHYGPRWNYVTPIDRKVAAEIVIPPGMETPPNQPGAAANIEWSARKLLALAI